VMVSVERSVIAGDRRQRPSVRTSPATRGGRTT
jgi:hypothetical protein